MKRSIYFSVSIAISILSICSTSSHAQMSNMTDIRNKIFYNDFNLDKSIQLISEINSLNLTDPIVKAYTGASEMLAAKYSWNPISKFSFLKNGLSKVNEAVISDDENVEIRFLRFYIENSLPKYLGLNKHLIGDKKIILEHLDSLSELGLTKDIALYINKFMIDHGKCTDEEITQINSSIEKLQFKAI